MACGMLAFQRAGVKVKNYYAYEIDKYAIKTVLHNFPEVQELGDVFDEDFSKYENIDFLIGGSPCTYWSIAQSPDKRETTASGLGWELFSQYVRAIKEAKPKYFIYENNKSMAKAIYESISETFGFEPIMINSALVSAQNRQRYYWVGKRNEDGTYSKVDIEQPEDKGILLKDVLDNAIRFSRKIGVCEPKDKSLAMCASDWRGINRNQVQNAVAEPVAFSMVGDLTNRRVGTKDKAYCLAANPSSDMSARVIEPVNTTIDGKSQTIKSQYSHTDINNICRYTSTYGASGVAELICSVDTSIQIGALPRPNGELSTSQAFRIYDTNGKSVTLKAGGCGAGDKTGLYAVPVSPVKVGEVGNGRQGNRIYSIEGKAITQQANSGGLGSNTGLYAIPFEFSDLVIRKNAHIAVNDNAIRGVQDKNNASCAENFYEFTDTKANTLTTAHRPKIIDELSNYVCFAEACEWNENSEPIKAISYVDGKKYIVYTVKAGQITIKGKQYPIKLKDGFYIIRKLTVSECKRLQTVPEWYEFPVSDTQAYKMLGNGWTVEVIAHLIRRCVSEK